MFIRTNFFSHGIHKQIDARNFVARSVELNQPVIVVAPNYRLAVFGFLASKELQQDMDELFVNIQHLSQTTTNPSATGASRIRDLHSNGSGRTLGY